MSAQELGERDPDLLAAEFVLGLLAQADHSAAERREQEDQMFAQAVSAWRARLSELDDTAPVVEPGGDLWSRIAQDLPAAERPARASRPGSPHAAAASRPSLAGRTRPLRGLAMAAALLVAAALGYLAQDRANRPSLIAVLIAEGGTQPAAVVSAYRDGRIELVPLQSIDVPPDQALQVWTLWDRAVGPRSVGLLDRARSIQLTTEGLPATRPKQLFEITLEPKSGSPTGRPTGPILMKGLTETAL